MNEVSLKIKLCKNNDYNFSVYNGELAHYEKLDNEYLIVVRSFSGLGTGRCLITAKRDGGGFAFMPEDANDKYPIYYKKEGVIVTSNGDERSFAKIEKFIIENSGLTDRERFEREKETRVKRRTR